MIIDCQLLYSTAACTLPLTAAPSRTSAEIETELEHIDSLQIKLA